MNISMDCTSYAVVRCVGGVHAKRAHGQGSSWLVCVLCSYESACVSELNRAANTSRTNTEVK